MKRRIRSTRLTKRETSFYCIDFSAYADDPAGLQAELGAVEAVLSKQTPDSLLVAVDLHSIPLGPELIEFFRFNASRPANPIRKMAILGVSGAQRIWYRLAKRVTWPKTTAFFEDYEKAKDWLISDRV